MDSLDLRHIADTVSPPRMAEGRFVMVCLVVGLLAGAGAWLLKHLISLMERLATHGLSPDALPWRYLWLPIVGTVIAALLQRYVLHQQLDHGTDRILSDLQAHRYYLRKTTMISPIICATFTLGLGGSAGSEGPIAYAAAAIGSNIGRWFRCPPQLVATLVAIGGGAGIAGIFKAPLGGFFFAIEVLSLSYSSLSLIGLATACLTAGMTAYTLSGFTPDAVFSDVPAFDPALLLWALPLGIFCGLYSCYYSGLMAYLTRRYRSIGHQWVKWLIAGASIGLMVFTFPSLYGEGYGVIGDILAGNGREALSEGSFVAQLGIKSPVVLLLLLAGATALLKSAASAATNDGGGVAGDFAPTIFAGAIVGYFFAVIATMALGIDVSLIALVFMAMGGVMAGAVRAPFMAMFIVVEMTGAWSLFLPLIITSAISYATVRFLSSRFAV